MCIIQYKILSLEHLSRQLPQHLEARGGGLLRGQLLYHLRLQLQLIGARVREPGGLAASEEGLQPLGQRPVLSGVGHDAFKLNI